MVDEESPDFKIISRDDDFVIESIDGIDPKLEEDFKLLSIREDSDFEVDRIYDTPPEESNEGSDFNLERTYEDEPIAAEMPSLESTKVLGIFDPNSKPVFISGTTWDAIQEHLSSFPQGQKLELGGAPIGTYCIDRNGKRFLNIQGYIPFKTVSTETSVGMPETEWYRAGEIVDNLRNKGSQVTNLGWIHSHPGFEPAPSPRDIRTANDHFRTDSQVTIIIDPINHVIGVFERDDQGGLINKKGVVIYGENIDSARDLSYSEKQNL